MIRLAGTRVTLRDWRAKDARPFAEMNADPVVMRYFARPLSYQESVKMLAVIREQLAERGWGLWALDIGGAFGGFVGLGVPPYETHFTPCVEVGWRLRQEFWGKGYATEAAKLALLHGFEEVGLDEIVSFTALANLRSQRVMQRLGMSRDESGDFDHPKLPPGHPLRRHCLYRIADTDGNRMRLRLP